MILRDAAIRNPDMYQHVPIEKRSRDMSLWVVNERGEMLAHVPIEMKDTEMCMTAFNDDRTTVKHFPYKIFTQELCNRLIGVSITCVNFCPIQFITQRHYFDALVARAIHYTKIPDHMLTLEMSLQYVSKGGNSKCIPTRFRMIVLSKYDVVKRRYVY